MFENFESRRLSSVLNFISKESRLEFINLLKMICEKINIPLSKLSDDMFEYLSLKDALDFNPSTKVKCGSCVDGKVKKPWGQEGKKGFHYRYLPCKVCDGVGKVPGSLSYIKFWFSASGKYVTSTCLDGSVGKLNFVKKTPISFSQLVKLETGTMVRVQISNLWVNGTIYQLKEYGRDQTYIIQNKRQGSVPRSSTDWRKYGPYSWSINSPTELTSSEYYVIKDDKDSIFNQPWNVGIDIRTLSPTRIVPDSIEDADFSLILDLTKLTKLENLAKIRSDRDQSKSGILSNDEIRSKNIERYFSSLSDISKFKDDKKLMSIEVSKIPQRIFGWSSCLYYILYTTHLYDYDNIISDYFKYVSQKISHSRASSNIIGLLERDYRSISRSKVLKSIESIEKSFSKDSDEFAFLEKLKDIGKLINNHILGSNIETFGDLELIYYKLYTIKKMMESDRYDLQSVCYFIRTLDSDGLDNQLDYLEGIDCSKAINSLDIISDNIRKM